MPFFIIHFIDYQYKLCCTTQPRLTADIRKDHRFYGYEKPLIGSTRLLLFSIFTNDVAGNPYKLK